MKGSWIVLVLALIHASCDTEGGVVPPSEVAAWLDAARVPARPDGLRHVQGLPDDVEGWTFRWAEPSDGPDESGSGLVRGWKNGESRARVEVALERDEPVLVRTFPVYRGDVPLAWLGEHTLHPGGHLVHYLRRNSRFEPEWELQIDGEGRIEHATMFDVGFRYSGRNITGGRADVPPIRIDEHYRDGALARVERWHEDGGLIDVRTRRGATDHVVEYAADGSIAREYEVEAE